MKELVGLISLLLYIHGWILAQGFWETLFAIVVFPYSYYLVLEHYLRMAGLL